MKENSDLTVIFFQILIYPLWHNVPGTSGDFALLRLKNSVPFSKSVSPICLPQHSDESFTNEVGTTVGWGQTEQGDISSVLREVT